MLDALRSNYWLGGRVVAGILVLAGLAIWDRRRNREKATRWREYLFLVAATLVAMAYGVINDQITSRISWEYFYYGKELEEKLGQATPPDRARLSWEAAKIGMMATWSAGLVAGVALLLANNPKKDRRQLSYRELVGVLPRLLVITIAFAVMGGILGYLGALTFIGDDFRVMVQEDLFRPRRFMCAYGVHLGGYVGGAVAIVYSVWRVRRLRARASSRGELSDPAPQANQRD
jgi:membrane associated rhomboid family serine protease